MDSGLAAVMMCYQSAKGASMGYLSMTDLEKTKALGEQLASEHEIFVTRDGKPMAIMIGAAIP